MSEPFVLRARTTGDGATQLLAPSVGVFTPAVARGALVGGGQTLGTLDVLGVRRTLLVPDGIAGRITQRVGGARSRVPIEFGDPLVTLSTTAFGESPASAGSAQAAAAGALTFAAPMSGRFYSRPSPNDPAFVSVGDEVSHGQTVGLLEVMKTFNRLVYQGETLPERATVERIVPSDGDDVVKGDPILLLAASEG
jgi:acetyl-CoA carboxylase biotin carboxyl carrier protein